MSGVGPKRDLKNEFHCSVGGLAKFSTFEGQRRVE
jgi:hypothetical protein